MAVARSDEGAGHATRRRGPQRRHPDGPPPQHGPPQHGPPQHSGTATATPPPPATQGQGSAPTGPGCRLDDLYRLPMPKLFSFAEAQGIGEHTGMNRGQLIVAVVRRLIERGEVARGSGTLEVLPDG